MPNLHKVLPARLVAGGVDDVEVLGGRVMMAYSGFGPSDWPIWTDLVGGNFRQRALFLVRATEKTKTVLDQKIPLQNYRSGKC